jgi:hypothetical protein
MKLETCNLYLQQFVNLLKKVFYFQIKGLTWLFNPALAFVEIGIDVDCMAKLVITIVFIHFLNTILL